MTCDLALIVSEHGEQRISDWEPLAWLAALPVRHVGVVEDLGNAPQRVDRHVAEVLS
jgi:hypothetical protein